MTTEAENYDNILNYSCFQFFFEKIKMAAVAVVAVKTIESVLFFLSKTALIQQFSLFLPLPFREKSERPEKAHSSLCSLLENLDNSHKEQGDWEDGGFPCCVRVCKILDITVERYHILYFALYGSPDPSNRNKEDGRLRSLCPFGICSLSLRAKGR